MDFYTLNVLALVTVNATLYYLHYKSRNERMNVTKQLAGGIGSESIFAADAVKKSFNKRFLPVYLLVFGADWLQGPYIYTMYKDEKGLTEETVAHLFTAGFLAAAVSATFVGSLADRYGRRCACRFFCLSYSISCVTILFNDITILFLGRVFGGLSSTLLYSVFESWMVTEYHRQHLSEAGGSLNDIFGVMTTLNSVVAISAGLFAQSITDFTKSQKAPFMAAIVCLTLAFWTISKQWSENYGDHGNRDTLFAKAASPEKNGFKLIKQDRRLWALAITSCFFEGSLYLWIFFKFPALRLSHQLSGKGTELPFGMIFTALMCAMMLGSLLFTWYSALHPKRWVIPPSMLLMFSLMASAWCFLIPVLIRNEAMTFWCFCIFEICCGIYFPTMGSLKEKIVDGGIRAKVYGALRVPLNIVVVVGLGLTQDCETHRDNMFTICGGALITAAAAVGLLLRE